MPRKHMGWWSVLALALVLAAYGWTWRSVGASSLSRVPRDYYGFLTDALTSGQLSLKVLPDARLARLPNPWASYQGIPRLHDASYFNGRYYLYFGATPVLVLLGPWRMLTGTFLAEGGASVVFGIVGFLAGLDLLRRLVSRPFPSLPPWSIPVGIVIWGIGNFAFILIQYPTFYVVPIMGAYACLMCALNAVGRASESAKPYSATGWMAVASLLWGLAVGARPNYLFSLPALGLPLAFMLARGRALSAKGGSALLLLATILPAAAIGACLAWYNVARFGSALEFGYHYVFASADQHSMKTWYPDRILPAIGSYLFQGSLISSNFPFVIPKAAVLGMVPTMPFAALAAAFPFTLLSRRIRESAAWAPAGLCAFAAGCAHLFSLASILPDGTARYAMDFAPEFILAALAAGAFILDAARRLPGAAARAVVILGLALAAVTFVNSGLLAVNASSDRKFKRALAEFLDRPAAALERALGLESGPVRLEVSLDELKVGERAPLVETGVGSDFLYIERVDARHVRLAFVHLGDPKLTGPSLAFQPGIRHTIVADLGSLYPPDEHPALKDWPQPMRDSLHRVVNVSLDGRPALVGWSAFFPSDSLHTYIGRDLGFGLDAKYPGVIYSASREGMPSREAVEASGWTGPVRLHLRFPPFSYFISEPLVATGRKGAGDLIYVSYVAPGRLRFGHDSTDGGSLETPDISYDPDAEHTLDVDLAQLRTAPDTTPAAGRAFQLRFDGRWLICADRRMHPTEPFEVVFGFDSLATGIAKDSFSGSVIRPEPMAALPPPAEPGDGIGPLEIAVLFPPETPGMREPLAVTGRAGAGDFVYVVGEANNRIRLGVDHWAVGGVVGDPIEIVPQQVHTITIASAALFPPADDPTWGSIDPASRAGILSRIRVDMDGRTVIDAPFTAYPSKPGQITVGANKIGGSTCGARFSGQVLSVRRLGMPPAQAR